MVVGGLFADRDHEAVEFKISGDRRKTASKASTLDMRTPDLRLLRELASKAPRENTFEDIGGPSVLVALLPPPPKGTGVGNFKMSEVQQTRQMAGLAEQDLLLELRQRQPVEERSGDMG